MYLGGVLINLGTLTPIPGDGSDNLITFDTLVFDDLGAWNPAAPTQLTVPAGVGHIRLFFKGFANIQQTTGSQAGTLAYKPHKNGNPPVPSLGIGGNLLFSTTAASQHGLQLSAFNQLVAATPGDVWQLVCAQTTGNPVNVNGVSLGLEFYD